MAGVVVVVVVAPTEMVFGKLARPSCPPPTQPRWASLPYKVGQMISALVSRHDVVVVVVVVVGVVIVVG